jgi:hypothetical protein
MANRYWILGAANWNSSNTANWSSSLPLSFTASRSGTTLTTVGSPALVVGMTVYNASGTSLGTIVSGSVNTWTTSSSGTVTSQTCVAANPGASVPTAADNVFFNANSNVGTGSFTVTMTITPRVCNDLTISGLDGVMTLGGGSTIALNVSGSLTFPATNFTRTYTGTTTFNATSTGKTVTTNGVAFGGAVTFDGVGGGWTLGSALTTTGALTVTNGTFSTTASNYAVTAGYLYSDYSTLRTINLNASTVTLSDNSGVYIPTTTNLTFNAGTSTINLSNASAEIASGGLTFYNVAFTSTAPTFLDITGVNTFNNLTFASRTTVGRSALSFDANQTINGTFTVSASTAAAYRTQISSTSIGATRTLTCASIAAMTDVDFRDITIAGAHGTLSGTRLGNGKGNSGITFPAAKTVYYRQLSSNDWGATGSGSWSATSGGALDATQFPLAQDTAVFPAATYPAFGSTTTINAGYYIGTIDMSLRTSNTMTLANGTFNVLVIGNWINGTGITLTGSGAISFLGRATQTITSAGRSFSQGLSFSNPSGSVTLQDALTQGLTVVTTLNQGTLDLNGFTCTIGTRFTTGTGTGTKNLTFNGGTLVCQDPSTTAFNNTSPTGFTTTAGTGTGTISMTAATAKTFVGGGSTFNCTLNQGGAGALTITGSNTFSNITNTVQPASVLFTAGTTSTFSSFSLSGTAGNLITIGSVTAASHTLSKASGTVSSSYLSISNSTATGGATWEALTANGNVNGGNNTGWIFNYILAFIYETATATDSVLSFADFYAALSETATATDSVLSLADFYAVLAETATATDSDVGFISFPVSIAETATATDSVIGLADFYAALSETATATDAVLSFADFYAALAETATATDAVLSFADFSAALAETATATDSPSVAASTFNAPVAETVTATDSPLVAPSTFNAPVAETVTISDLVLGAYLWNLIDDSQSVTWQNVNSSPGTTWSPIDTDPNTGWTDIPTVN